MDYFYRIFPGDTKLIEGGALTADGYTFLNHFPSINDCYITLLVAPGYTPSPGMIDMIKMIFPNINYGAWEADKTYEFTDNPDHYVRTKSSFGDTPLYYNNTEIYGRPSSSSTHGFVYGVTDIYSTSAGPTSGETRFCIIMFNDDYTDYITLGFTVYWTEHTQQMWLYRSSISGPIYVNQFYNFFRNVEPSPDPPAPSDTDPYANIDGEGALPGGADVDLPAEHTLSALDAGMFALFSPSSSQMKALAAYLWTDFGGAGTDVVAMLGEVVEALKRTVANPLDLVLGLSIIASQGLSKGGSSNVHVGFWDTGVSMTKLSKQYFTVDCGSVSFGPVCGDTFLDYAPYSKFSIFLPYVGTKILDANDVVGHTISVKYRGDCVTGGLVCYLKRDGTIIAEFAGNCALNLPLSAESWGQTISGGLSIVAGAVGGAVKGGAAGAATGAVSAAASVATNPSVLSPQVEYTSAVAGGSGHMGSQKPFILREAVRFHSTSHFNTVTGYPSFYFKKLGDCTGFTQVVDVHIHGLSATGAELTEIETLLKGGVIL